MATEVKRGAGVAMILALVAATAGLGFAVATAADRLGTQESSPRTRVSASPQSAPVAPPQDVLPAAAPLAPRPAVLEEGDQGPAVRELQARLRQIAWFAGDVTNQYGKKTTAAVRGFQAKRGLPVLGYVDDETLQRLEKMTREPTADELANKAPRDPAVNAPLDLRCLTGRVLCVDKTSRSLRWVVDGQVLKRFDVRFGASYSPTREGEFKVGWKSRDHVSSLFHTAMPFAMFFSGGQAVHYSSDFAARGYSGASHGCVNVRDYEGLSWLFDQVRVGDKVVIYWS